MKKEIIEPYIKENKVRLFLKIKDNNNNSIIYTGKILSVSDEHINIRDKFGDLITLKLNEIDNIKRFGR